MKNKNNTIGDKLRMIWYKKVFNLDEENIIGNRQSSISSGWVQKASEEKTINKYVGGLFSQFKRWGIINQKSDEMKIAENVSLRTKLP